MLYDKDGKPIVRDTWEAETVRTALKQVIRGLIEDRKKGFDVEHTLGIYQEMEKRFRLLIEKERENVS